MKYALKQENNSINIKFNQLRFFFKVKHIYKQVTLVNKNQLPTMK